MARPLEHLGDAAALDDPAGIHHQDALADLRDDAEVVGDEDQRSAGLAAQFIEQLEHPRLGGHVERGGRLVGDQQRGVVGERHRDHHSLALAAGHLVRVGGGLLLRLRNPHPVEQLDRPRGGRLPAQPLMATQALGHLLADRQQRVQRRDRVLEDVGDAPAADVLQMGERRADQILALEQDAPAGDLAGRGRHEAEDRHRGH